MASAGKLIHLVRAEKNRKKCPENDAKEKHANEKLKQLVIESRSHLSNEKKSHLKDIVCNATQVEKELLKMKNTTLGKNMFSTTNKLRNITSSCITEPPKENCVETKVGI